MAIIPAITQLNTDNGPSKPAPNEAAIYISATTIVPITRLITS
jgi:hypothetical protein